MCIQVYLKRFTASNINIAFHSTVFAKRTLLAEFTTIRDLVGSGVNKGLKNAINKGYADGPRIYSAGKSIVTSSVNADPTYGI